MAYPVEVKVPDIGDFKDVAIIELLVKPGEVIAVDTALIVVESDKASMEIPSSQAGTVKELKVKLGDKVSEGSVILVVEAAGAARLRRRKAPAPAAGASALGSCRGGPSARAARSPRLAARSRQGRHRMRDARARRRTRRLFGRLPQRRHRHEDGARRALRHAGRRLPERRLHPVEGTAAYRQRDGRGQVARPSRDQVRAPGVDVDALRGFKDGVVKKLTGGLAGMAKARKVEVVTGVGSFLDPHHLEVVGAAARRRS
jgi:dihydrolipoamide dehydrogenase